MADEAGREPYPSDAELIIHNKILDEACESNRGLCMFWQYVYMRQLAATRRFTYMAPWSADPYIAAYRLPVIYPEMSRGQLYAHHMARQLTECGFKHIECRVFTLVHTIAHIPTLQMTLNLMENGADVVQMQDFLQGVFANKFWKPRGSMPLVAVGMLDLMNATEHALEAARRNGLMAMHAALASSRLFSVREAKDISLSTWSYMWHWWPPKDGDDPMDSRSGEGLDGYNVNIRRACKAIRPDMPTETAVLWLRERQDAHMASWTAVRHGASFMYPYSRLGVVTLRVQDIISALQGFDRWLRLRDGEVRTTKPYSYVDGWVPEHWEPKGWRYK